jgi:hypothetical protein
MRCYLIPGARKQRAGKAPGEDIDSGLAIFRAALE